MNSDKNLKANIREIEGALKVISELRGVEFDWKNSGKRGMGYIAQEIQEHYPELIKRGPDGYLSVDYLSFNAVLLQGIKELNQERLETKEELRDVSKRLQAIEEHISKKDQRESEE